MFYQCDYGNRIRKWLYLYRQSDGKYNCQSQTSAVNVAVDRRSFVSCGIWSPSDLSWPLNKMQTFMMNDLHTQMLKVNAVWFCDVSVRFTWALHTRVCVCVEVYSSPLAEWNQHFASIFGCFSLWPSAVLIRTSLSRFSWCVSLLVFFSLGDCRAFLLICRIKT